MTKILVAMLVAVVVAVAMLVPACWEQEARGRQIEADIVANLGQGGMTDVEVRDMLASRPGGIQMSVSRTRDALRRMARRGQISMVLLRADGSPAQWYEVAATTRWVSPAN